MLEKKTKKVTQTVEVDEEVFVLTMSREEAEVIFSLLSKCNSVHQTHTSDLWQQFNNTDVDVRWNTVIEYTSAPTGTIRLVEFE